MASRGPSHTHRHTACVCICAGRYVAGCCYLGPSEKTYHWDGNMCESNKKRRKSFQHCKKIPPSSNAFARPNARNVGHTLTRTRSLNVEPNKRYLRMYLHVRANNIVCSSFVAAALFGFSCDLVGGGGCVIRSGNCDEFVGAGGVTIDDGRDIPPSVTFDNMDQLAAHNFNGATRSNLHAPSEK